MQSRFRLSPLRRAVRSALLLLASGLASVPSARAAVNNPDTGATASAVHTAPSSGPSPQYTDGGTTTTTVTTQGFSTPYYYGNTSSAFGHYNNSFLPGTSFGSATVTVQHRPIYFPPDAPALGEPARRRDHVALAKFAPPAQLANYVYEPFYAPLSTLLFTEDLSRKRRDRLDAFRSSRTALLAELHARLDSLRTADPATRARELSAFAAEQAPRLATLNATAEELRSNFAHGGFFESSSDWNETRNWRLGDNTRWESQIDEIKVMRGAAAFQAGLSGPQRRLLREIAMELADALKGPAAEISLDSPGPFLYFSPATARIRLPADLPAELLAKIDAYKAAKAALKTELRETLYVQDRAWFEYKRVNTLKALAEKQAPGLAALEDLAEEIRRDLVPYPNPARPPELPLPTHLAPRVRSYHQRKVALQTLLVEKLAEVRAALPDDRVEYTRTSDTYVLEVIPNRRATPEQKAKRQSIVESLAPFNQTQTSLYSALAREKESIRAAILREASALSGQSSAKSIEQLLKEFAYAFQRQEAWELYRDYETAVLEPGLSPAQRELLFGAALEKLDLPLAN